MIRETSIGYSNELIMQTSTVFKWIHRSITLLLLLAVIIGGLLWRSEAGPYDDSLYSKKELSDGVWLYITQYNNAGATDSEVYRYYLNKKLADPLPVLQKSAPFLTTNTKEVTVTAIGQHIMVRLTGKIYSFSNSAFFYDGSAAVIPRIDLNAQAARN
ncbi:hypothetical protein [Mixta hanseatica]|uniref:Uncharacterized protein n=1 Tax=Mixta hanseatica TaxID=2872648 RepID=A0ABY4RDH7_9GAMM|nr:hypothetical protein [Mixta hanseatica]UQY45413.1 hypothetical protein K6958_07065 [Mixta hanseatica]